MTDKPKHHTRSLVGNDIVPASRNRKPTAHPAQQANRPPAPKARRFDDVIRPGSKRAAKARVPRQEAPEVTHAADQVMAAEPIAEYLPLPTEKEAVRPKRSAFKPLKDAKDPYFVTISFDLFVVVLLGYAGMISHALPVAFIICLAGIIFMNISVKRLLVSSLICLALVPVLQLLGQSSLERTYAYCFAFFAVAAIGKHLVAINGKRRQDSITT